MAQAQAHKTSTKEVTMAQSVALMKNLVRASISEVCFIRNLFPSDCFRHTNFGATAIRALCPRELGEDGKTPTGKIINEDALLLSQWQEAAFEALEKGYLRSIVLGIYTAEDDPEKRLLIESYVFNFKYPKDDYIQMEVEKDKEKFSVSRVRDEASTIVRSLIRLAETMKPVPEERYLSLKLFYFDDLVPHDYQPKHFTDATNEHHQFFLQPPLKVNLGSVESKHHAVSLKVAFREDLTEENGIAAAAEDAMMAEIPAEEGAAGASRESAVVIAPAASAAPSSPAPRVLLEGIDPQIYEITRSMISSINTWSVKALMDALKGMSVPSAPGMPVVNCDVSQEQARRLLRQLEGDGLLRKISAAVNSKYEITAAAIAEKEALEAASKPAPGTASAVAGPASAAGGDAAEGGGTAAASAWLNRGIVAVLGNYSWRKAIKTSDLEHELTLGNTLCKALVQMLQQDGLLAPAGHNGMSKSAGRPIIWSGKASKQQLAAAQAYLQSQRLPQPLEPKNKPADAEPVAPSTGKRKAGASSVAATPGSATTDADPSDPSTMKKRSRGSAASAITAAADERNAEADADAVAESSAGKKSGSPWASSGGSAWAKSKASVKGEAGSRVPARNAGFDSNWA